MPKFHRYLLTVLLILPLAMAGCGNGEDVSTESEAQTKRYSAEEIKAAMREHIQHRTQEGVPDVFEIVDIRTGDTLLLNFVKIHDPVRNLGGNRYFACTDFHTVGQPDKLYDLDFWLMPLDGELVVYQENIHKLPAREDGEWEKQPRYTFIDDGISLLR